MRKYLIALIALALLVAGALYVARSRGDEWTCESTEALSEYERGLDARMKLYGPDAARHFARAVELDPGFVAAKLNLRYYERDQEARKRITAELEQVDLERLTARERFLVSYELARAEDRGEEAERILDGYLERHPNDPFALAIRSAVAWEGQDWEKAEHHYHRLLEVDPNWVVAQNNLGYIAMALGRFADAEEQFRTYKYVAPDQANPHDSMGELLTLLGRYEEAEQELQEALRIKPDFCPSYEHLADLAIVQGKPEDAASGLAGAEEHCPESVTKRLHCQVEWWGAFYSGDYEIAWREESADCRKRMGEGRYLVHRLALMAGRLEEAEVVEGHLRETLESYLESNPVDAKMIGGTLRHMEGSRLAITGSYAEAAKAFKKADKDMVFWGQGAGILKLYNQLHLAVALERLGDSEASRRLVEKVAKVNPGFAGFYTELLEAFPETAESRSG